MFNYQHPSIVPSSQRNIAADENAGIAPTVNKPIHTTNIHPIKLSKPYISSVSSNTQQQGTQRTCLGDISNQVHLLQKSVVPAKPQVIKPNLPNTASTTSMSNVPIITTLSSTTTRLMSKPPHRLGTTTTTSTTTTTMTTDTTSILPSNSNNISTTSTTSILTCALNEHKDHTSLIPSVLTLQEPSTLSSPPPRNKFNHY
ncbi:hypothetical protein C9374_004573 [Naegleria lovaniensis]|uniref:Uncharacterized protein n=1 Tax=Naegleria lovaniensis TaxID=51637 RepID=A0AA88GLK1_NAELO|nr:uncharacterized protein C9374_004573 [Naegleria lovaniensis]KAG2383236.1 hypothetical protein C9374_004573 [Naegleria lovaniensis]